MVKPEPGRGISGKSGSGGEFITNILILKVFILGT
jgi:hypothetical protein